MLSLGGPALTKTCAVMIVTSCVVFGCSTPRYHNQSAMMIVCSVASTVFCVVFLPSVLAIAGPPGNWGYVWICFGDTKVSTNAWLVQVGSKSWRFAKLAAQF